MRVSVAEIAAQGGYEAWHRRVTAKANRAPIKSGARDKKRAWDEQPATAVPKSVGDGRSARNSHTPGVPNQTEQRYRDEFLIPRILSGEIAECVFEGRTFELAHRCTYTPDWWCRLADGQEECHEVKGAHVWEDSRVKCKVAARMYQEVRFVWGQWRQGRWNVREVPK